MNYPYYSFQMRTAGPSNAFSDMPAGISFAGDSAYSIAAWIYMKDYAGMKEVISQGDDFTFGVDDQQLLIRLNGNVIATSKNVVTSEEWHYIAIVFDILGYRFYCDGEFLTFVSGNGNTVSLSGNLIIGRNLNGYIRNAVLYSSALTPDDLKNYMFSVKNAAAYYDFTSNPAIEHVNNLKINYDGLADIVKTATAAMFKNQGYLKIESGSKANPGGNINVPYTIQAWIYLDASDSTGCCTILHNTNIGNDTGVLFTVERELNDKGDAEFYLCLRHGMFTYESNFLKSTTPIPQKQWVNVAAVFEKATCRIYIDNSLALLKSGLLPIPSELDDPICYIGSKVNGGTENGTDVFEGAISRIDIWDKALSEDELIEFSKKLPDTASDGNNPKDAFFFQNSFVDLIDFIPAGRMRGVYLGMTEPEATQKGEHEGGMDDSASENPYTDMEIPNELRTIAIQKYLEQHQKVNGTVIEAVPEHFFAVDHFEKDEKIYFVIHLAKESYIVSDMVKNDDDPDSEYILWMTELIIIVVGGICFILFGLSPASGQAIVGYIRQNIVNIPSLGSIFMGATEKNVAAKCIDFILELYHQNVLKALLRVMFSVNLFTVIKIGIILIARALGGVVSLLAEIASLAVTVALHLAKHSSTPFALEEITFHSTSNTVGSIMCSDSDLSDLAEAEWRKRRNIAYPLLYCITDIYNNTANNPTVKKITVKIKLNIQSDYVGKAFVRAIDRTAGDESLGNSNEVSIKLNGYKQETQFLSVDFPAHTIRSAVNSFQLVLEWQVKLENKDDWIRLAVSQNTVYVIPRLPDVPWIGSTLPCIPFIELSYPWVKGASTCEEIAGRITSKINSMHDVFSYETMRGAPRYVSGAAGVDYNRLLNDLQNSGTLSVPVKINCSDCACMVAIFSNLWGCTLRVRRMEGKGGVGFKLNKVIAIGTGSWGLPFKGGFRFHAVAANFDYKISKPSDKDLMVYDACLEYDNRDTPWDNADDAQRVPFLPVNVPFSTLSAIPPLPMPAAPENSYREHLAANRKDGIGICNMRANVYNPYFKSNANRQISVSQEIRDYYKYDKWASAEACGQSAFYKPDSMIQFDEYKLIETSAYLGIAGSYHNRYIHDDIPENTIELIVVPCSEPGMAHEVMLQMLSSISSSDLKLTEPDGVFANASVLFTSQNESGSVKMTCIGNLFLTIITGGQVDSEQIGSILRNRCI
ncbi:LamG-like jellyroll fold domain-containing protein [Roseburia hominis]